MSVYMCVFIYIQSHVLPYCYWWPHWLMTCEGFGVLIPRVGTTKVKVCFTGRDSKSGTHLSVLYIWTDGAIKNWSRGNGGSMKQDTEATVPRSKMAAVMRKWDTWNDVNKRWSSGEERWVRWLRSDRTQGWKTKRGETRKQHREVFLHLFV